MSQICNAPWVIKIAIGGTGVYPWNIRWFSAMNICLQSNSSHCDTHCITLLNVFYIFFVFYLHYCTSMMLRIYDINSHTCTFLCWMSIWEWPKKAETCRSVTSRLYIIVSNCSAVVGYICIYSDLPYFTKHD